MIDKEKISIEYPVMFKACLSEETVNAVPGDVIEIEEFSDQKALVLPKGDYRLQLYNIQGDSLSMNAKVE